MERTSYQNLLVPALDAGSQKNLPYITIGIPTLLLRSRVGAREQVVHFFLDASCYRISFEGGNTAEQLSGKGDFTAFDGSYWTFTEFSAINAWSANANTGYLHYHRKLEQHGVRCVRDLM